MSVSMVVVLLYNENYLSEQLTNDLTEQVMKLGDNAPS